MRSGSSSSRLGPLLAVVMVLILTLRFCIVFAFGGEFLDGEASVLVFGDGEPGVVSELVSARPFAGQADGVGVSGEVDFADGVGEFICHFLVR